MQAGMQAAARIDVCRRTVRIRETLPAARFGGFAQAEYLPGKYDSSSVFQSVSVMDLLWVFAAVAPLAVGSLVAFAAHIDPLSGHWRPPGSNKPKDETFDT